VPQLRFAGFVLASVAQSRIVRAAGGDLIRRRARAGVRTVRLVQLDVPARQYPRRDDEAGDTGIRGTDTCQLQSELVHSPARARIGVVLRSGAELDRAKKVGVGRAADIADVRAGNWLEVSVDALAAYVQAGEYPARVVVHEVQMAEEPVMLAPSDQAEVRVIPVVRDHEPAAGGEVARTWNDFFPGFRGGAPAWAANRISTHANRSHASAASLLTGRVRPR